ncbi:MAG: hypothetical protein HUU07_00110 [Candidatus Brocadia sinica]|uniref:hypothetical protein n=1 Tax=Candidatus Brocadia sp. AMX2 TaxID=2293635 RepID=UPI0017BF76C6|nr:hypothetical protein [Candidatus Brocadia sp. AMX2]NUO03815.1 hypothetical protein [Candidatus Brocadia sinica]
MKTVFIAFCLLLISNIAYPVFAILAQGTQTNSMSTTQQVQSSPVPPPELPPTPRSKLEIIQYILLPFAIGASIWLLLRLEKMEREERKGDER